MEQEKETEKRKEKHFPKANWKKHGEDMRLYFKWIFSTQNKREDIGILEDAPVGYCGLT